MLAPTHSGSVSNNVSTRQLIGIEPSADQWRLQKSGRNDGYCVTHTTKLNSTSLEWPVIFQQPSVEISMPVTMKGCWRS